MELHAKLVRSQLNFFKPLAEKLLSGADPEGAGQAGGADDGHAPAGDLFP